MELPLDVMYHISTYLPCNCKSLCAVSRELRAAIHTRAYFTACGPVWIEDIPRSAHVFVQSFMEERRSLIEYRKLSYEYIYSHADTFGWSEWHMMWNYHNLSEEFLDKYHNKLPNEAIFETRPLSEPFLRRHMSDLVGWHIFNYQIVSESFIRDYMQAYGIHPEDWEDIAIRQNLSEDFIAEFKANIGWLRDPHSDMWFHIPKNNTLSDLFIHRYAHCLCWERVSKYCTLSEEFMTAHIDKLHWYGISKHQKLSENFVALHRDRVVWPRIKKYQRMSKEFIRAHER